jgi:phenylalanyl-tRNA synthetase alpha chain
METNVLSAEALERALSVRDLTEPAAEPHAMRLVVDAIAAALGAAWKAEVREHRGPPIVAVADNYDRLGYAPDAAARDARYTRYVGAGRMLRSHTSAMIPGALAALAGEPPGTDVVLVCPGLVYRRDVVDRLHTGEPHQVDLWRIRRTGPALGEPDLEEMIARVVAATLPGRVPRTTPAVHPYTLAGRQIDVPHAGDLVEIGECGLAHPAVLCGAGLGAPASGLAMGLGLDRLLMLRKGLDDIRLLRSSDPRVLGQMRDLEPYRPISRQPAAPRDLSIAVAEALTPEELGDRVREALGDGADRVESIEVREETPYAALPAAAVERLGIGPGQKNVLLRVVLRDLRRSLSHREANELRDAIYEALHEGTVHAWAAR